MTDTAEYWHDVKKHHSYKGTQFYHIPGADCGHRHYHEAKSLHQVNCFSCLELLQKGYEHNLNPIQVKQTNGRCSCGSSWVKRINKATGQQFLGCSAYPKCKKSKSL